MQFTLSISKMPLFGSLALSCLLSGCATQPQVQSDSKDSEKPGFRYSDDFVSAERKPEEYLKREVEAVTIASPTQREVFTSKLITRHLWNDPRIERQYQNYLSQTRFSTRLKPRWEQFFGYVLAEVEARDLPSEIAVVPLVESLLDPYAFSADAAVGMWQFVDATARENGLPINWWYDGRRDPMQSTQAALNYLEKLYKRFNDWPLALAAYNGGAARISRALSNQKKDNFWELKLASETANYVPRIIALSRMMSQAPQFDLKWPTSDQPAFVEVIGAGQIDLSNTARKLNITTEELYRFNPGLSRWATPPMGPHRLLVATNHAKLLQSMLAENSTDSAWQRYAIQNGDSLSHIAHKFRVETSDLKSVNSLTSSKIRAGDTLVIPGSHQPSAETRTRGNPFLFNQTRQSQPKVYRVKSGDSFWSIARKFKVNMNKLIKTNRLNPKRALQIGQRILI